MTDNEINFSRNTFFVTVQTAVISILARMKIIAVAILPHSLKTTFCSCGSRTPGLHTPNEHCRSDNYSNSYDGWMENGITQGFPLHAHDIVLSLPQEQLNTK